MHAGNAPLDSMGLEARQISSLHWIDAIAGFCSADSLATPTRSAQGRTMTDRSLLAQAARLEAVLARWPGLTWAVAVELAGWRTVP